MTPTPVYLHALGMVNSLGADLDTIVRALTATHAPGSGPMLRHGREVFVAQVMASLEQGPSGALAAYDCRNNRLLLAALSQIETEIESACARYGAHRVAVVLGTSTSGVAAAEAAFREKQHSGAMPVQFDYRQMEIGAVAPFAAASLGLRGLAYTISTACTSSAKAFVSARRLLQLNLCDAVVVGGVDSLCELTLQGFAALESTSATRSNPMSRNRCGINLGEGAAVFLMSRQAAEVRLAGAGESSDAHHISAPDPQGVGAEMALRAALADAGLQPSAIGYVNLHATATRKNDEMEARMMARVFPAGVAASGTKPLTGHQLGAAGATELGFAWLTLARGMALPRHIWDGEADPELPPMDLVETRRDLPRYPNEQYVMSNSFAFGGSNVSLILGRHVPA